MNKIDFYYIFCSFMIGLMAPIFVFILIMDVVFHYMHFNGVIVYTCFAFGWGLLVSMFLIHATKVRVIKIE